MQAQSVDPLYHAPEIMNLWNISKPTLDAAIKSGELPGFHDNGKFATKAHFINEWLELRIKTAKTPGNTSATKVSKESSPWDQFLQRKSNHN